MNEHSQSVYSSGSNAMAIELLRTGTPHNQTLSPGVTYLALSEDQPPTEFRIELEQYKFSRYLQLLRYQVGIKTIPIQLAKEALQEIITKIFEGIPALQAKTGCNNSWLHIRLIMTPRELAMLPFELALTPNGFQGGHDVPFLMNPQRLTTITREVRQVAPKKYNWPVKPRILFIWAEPETKSTTPNDPEDPNAVPADKHLDKLKEALRPWVCPNKKETEPEEDYSPLITELKNATYSELQSKVEEAVQQNSPYTHIHILAHGIPIADPDLGPRFALALKLDKPIRKKDISIYTDAVDGSRLADALRCVNDNQFYSPAVVTIAACDGGNDGTNLLPGGSMAHILHQSGFPYVLASQFPLSMDGSVKLVKEFYPRILLGEDPRTALYYTRKAVNCPDIHDWASLVAYARFPDNFEDQLEDIQLKITLEIMKVANTWTDFALKDTAGMAKIGERVEEKLTYAITKLEKLLSRNKETADNPARMAEHLGLLGSAYKRLAEYYYNQGKRPDADLEALTKKSRTALEKARTYYQRGHDLVLINHWTAVQYLSLTAILKGTLLNEHDRWCVTLFAAEKDLVTAKGESRIWAFGTLAELYMLKPFTVRAEEFEAEKAKALEKAGDYLDEITNSDFAFAKESTARQFERYIKWWPVAFPSPMADQLKEMAEQLIKHLPPLAT
ncbi:CHAT domain-containing protein [Spirosoma sp. HMF4905]|uniref:CHAT domain-containing protein n=1 Tax=Spirosoma arboris TaxID=2682092 RepID=A0A7K1S516_9BACT|nr:CHAT domain-containing protein [Spirosoma arboris]MVM28909.1 CHAT domain-containing protein [Spirosoma arboris]